MRKKTRNVLDCPMTTQAVAEMADGNSKEWIGIFLAGGVALSESDVMAALSGTRYAIGFMQYEDTEQKQIIEYTRIKALHSEARHIGMPINLLSRQEWKRNGPGRILPDPVKQTKASKGQDDAVQIFTGEQ